LSSNLTIPMKHNHIGSMRIQNQNSTTKLLKYLTRDVVRTEKREGEQKRKVCVPWKRRESETENNENWESKMWPKASSIY